METLCQHLSLSCIMAVPDKWISVRDSFVERFLWNSGTILNYPSLCFECMVFFDITITNIRTRLENKHFKKQKKPLVFLANKGEGETAGQNRY